MNATETRLTNLRRITRGPEAWRLATAAYDDLVALLDDLDAPDWEALTVCTPWTVADMVGHLIGAAESEARIREGIRQQVWAHRHKGDHGGSDLDAWTALHVREHAHLTVPERLARLREVAPRAVRGRSRFPSLLGRISVALAPAGSVPAGSPDRVGLGELNTVIYTRDTWLHRIDITRATGRTPRLRPDVDGRIVQDVAIEWAGRHGQPVHLELTGPAGGTYVQGTDGPHVTIDAVEFAWILSGRGEPDRDHPGAHLLRTRVLF